MKKFFLLLIYILFEFSMFACNEFENVFDDNGEWTIEYQNMIRSLSFGSVYEDNVVHIDEEIQTYKYGIVIFPGTNSKSTSKITIYDKDMKKIVWYYGEYVNANKIRKDSWTSYNFRYLDYNLDIHEKFSVSVINDNSVTYLVTLLSGCLVTVYECNFNLGQLDLIMEKKIPPIITSKIVQDRTILQEDGIRKIFNLVMNSEYKIQLESTKIDNFNFQEQETFPSALYLNQNSEITTTSYLTEGATTYNIENAKTIEGLPFVPAMGETYSNVITLKTDTPNNRGFVIQNGYISKERPDLYGKNCRVKTLKVIYPNIESPFEQIVTLKDDTSLQFVPFMWNLLDDCKEVQIVIDSVYQGTKYDDVCINYIGLVTQTPVEISER